ncbi:DinB superfamily protein [Chitinophaga jiangningensis]|uniref:DinB superfamily protein n=1 Tax=Chitinophaga jiangningensis TaxID=1419482 RepID=A0A1M7J706_9BACT|nr:DinB family protein [Chitinophaga jiangningensis]SHM48722.1 DinB superfamily protein [Chitinophaga jiangningensis]
MKTIHHPDDRSSLIARIHALPETNPGQWGKMNMHQMIQHCILWEDLMLRKKEFRQVFIGKLFGKMALRALTKDDAPIRRNAPTDPHMKITGVVTERIPVLKQQWITLLQEHAHYPETGIMHPFFGKMTGAEVGILVYKHTDHHLRQFGG